MQIWYLPSSARLQPKYFTRHISDEEKADEWARVVAPIEAKGVLHDQEGESPVPVQSPLTLYATLLSGESLERRLEGGKGYIHVIQRSGYNAGKGQGSTVKVSSKGGEATAMVLTSLLETVEMSCRWKIQGGGDLGVQSGVR